MQQAHIYYSGEVQGVGFRFTVQRYAQKLNLTGWVKNLPDGRVETLIEGPKGQIQKLCQLVENSFNGYIRNKEIEFVESEGAFGQFTITF